MQGAELDVLEGAQRLLSNAVALVLEVSLLNVFEQGRELAEVVGLMKEKGFVVYDLFGPNYRPYDGALSQIDLVFVPHDSPARDVRWYASANQRAELNQRFAKQHRQHGL